MGDQLSKTDSMEFLDKITAFIPPSRRHRHHYHGAFAPSAPIRPMIAKAATRIPSEVQQTADEVTKVSLGWAKLIARIYEVNPLLCTFCGKEMKIRTIVTDKSKIWCILKRIGWPIEIPDFDPPSDLSNLEVCQLIPGTSDGFSTIETHCTFESNHDPPQGEENIDPPHWEDANYIIYS